MTAHLKINITRAEESHLPLLVSMQQAMCIETEERELKTETITNGLKKALLQPELGARVFIATLADPEDQTSFNTDSKTPIAMMMNTTEFDLHRNSTIIWFQSVYVMPAFRRRGIFKNFFAFIKSEVQNDPKSCSIRLDVDCTNERAQATYRSMGMKLEGVRIVRFTKPGVEPESVSSQNSSPVKESTKEADPHSISNTSMTNSSGKLLHAPEALKYNIKVTRVLKENVISVNNNKSFIDELAQMQFESSSLFFPSTFPSKIKSLEKTRAGLQSIIDSPEKVGAELYIAELVDEEENDNNKKNNNTTKNKAANFILGSVVLTHEWSDWRDGLVLNGFGSFASNLEEKNLRAECLRAFIRAFKERTIKDDGVSGIRFSYEEDVEMNLKGETEGKSDHACEEEGMFIERYYLMRYDK